MSDIIYILDYLSVEYSAYNANSTHVDYIESTITEGNLSFYIDNKNSHIFINQITLVNQILFVFSFKRSTKCTILHTF
jgi:hypothetical protein